MPNRAIKDQKVTIDDVAAEASPAGKGSAQSPTIAAYVALVLLFALYVLNWAHRQIISMFLEPIRRDMGLTDTQIGIFGGLAFTLFYAVAALPIASLSDRRSRPLILAICVGLWSLSLSATGFAKSFVHLLVTRALLGIGEAGFGPTANALVATYFPPPRLARAAAIFGAGASVGIFVAYGVGGWLLASVGWRKGLMLAGLPGILLSVIILLVLKDGRAERAHPPNRGSLMWAGMSAFFASRALMFFITGAVLATMNVGAFSALNGVAGAYAERLPVIFVASGYNTNDASASHLLHHSLGTHDFSYQYEMFKYVTCAAVRASKPAMAASVRNLTIGDCRPSRPFAASLTFTYARPLAP